MVNFLSRWKQKRLLIKKKKNEFKKYLLEDDIENFNKIKNIGFKIMRINNNISQQINHIMTYNQKNILDNYIKLYSLKYKNIIFILNKSNNSLINLIYKYFLHIKMNNNEWSKILVKLVKNKNWDLFHYIHIFGYKIIKSQQLELLYNNYPKLKKLKKYNYDTTEYEKIKNKMIDDNNINYEKYNLETDYFKELVKNNKIKLSKKMLDKFINKKNIDLLIYLAENKKYPSNKQLIKLFFGMEKLIKYSSYFQKYKKMNEYDINRLIKKSRFDFNKIEDKLINYYELIKHKNYKIFKKSYFGKLILYHDLFNLYEKMNEKIKFKLKNSYLILKEKYMDDNVDFFKKIVELEILDLSKNNKYMMNIAILNNSKKIIDFLNDLHIRFDKSKNYHVSKYKRESFIENLLKIGYVFNSNEKMLFRNLNIKNISLIEDKIKIDEKFFLNYLNMARNIDNKMIKYIYDKLENKNIDFINKYFSYINQIYNTEYSYKIFRFFEKIQNNIILKDKTIITIHCISDILLSYVNKNYDIIYNKYVIEKLILLFNDRHPYYYKKQINLFIKNIINYIEIIKNLNENYRQILLKILFEINNLKYLEKFMDLFEMEYNEINFELFNSPENTSFFNILDLFTNKGFIMTDNILFELFDNIYSSNVFNKLYFRYNKNINMLNYFTNKKINELISRKQIINILLDLQENHNYKMNLYTFELLLSNYDLKENELYKFLNNFNDITENIKKKINKKYKKYNINLDKYKIIEYIPPQNEIPQNNLIINNINNNNNLDEVDLALQEVEFNNIKQI
jgi:hypothetical protein